MNLNSKRLGDFPLNQKDKLNLKLCFYIIAKGHVYFNKTFLFTSFHKVFLSWQTPLITSLSNAHVFLYKYFSWLMFMKNIIFFCFLRYSCILLNYFQWNVIFLFLFVLYSTLCTTWQHTNWHVQSNRRLGKMVIPTTSASQWQLVGLQNWGKSRSSTMSTIYSLNREPTNRRNWTKNNRQHT